MMHADRRHRPHRLHDVAERAQFDDEDFRRRNSH
jgi:hypothetical protein